MIDLEGKGRLWTVAAACLLALPPTGFAAREHAADPAAASPGPLGPRVVVQAVVLGVRDAVALALDRGLELKASTLDLRASRLQHGITRRGFLPSLAATGTARRSRDGRSAALDETEAGFTGSWKLRNGMLLSASYTGSPSRQTAAQGAALTVPLWRDAGAGITTLDEKNSASALKLADSGRDQSRQDTIAQSVQAYFGVELARMKADAAREAVGRALDIARINAALVKAGRVARMSLSQNDYTVAQAQVSLAQAEQEVKVAERALLKAIGHPQSLQADVQIGLKDSFTEQHLPLPSTLEETLQLALPRRHDLLSRREELKTAERAVLRARNDARPRLDLKFETSRPLSGPRAGAGLPDANASGLGHVRNNSVALTLEIPLDRVQLRMAQDVALLGQRKAELQLEAQERDVTSEINEAFSKHAFQRRQVELAQRAVDLAREQLDAEVLKVKAGRSSAADTAASQESLRQAEQQLIQARFDVFAAALALQRSLGSLSVTWTAADSSEKRP